MTDLASSTTSTSSTPRRLRTGNGWAALAQVVTGGAAAATPAAPPDLVAPAIIPPVAGAGEVELAAGLAQGGGLPITGPTPAGVTGIASPWSDADNLSRVMWEDVYGLDTPRPMSRSVAMGIPAVARARHLIAGTIARLPLTVWRGAELLNPQPLWTTRTDTELSTYHRNLWTVDDLFFSGWSLWRVVRGAGDEVLAAGRIAIHRWRIEEESGRVLVDDKPVGEGEVVLIPGAHEGLLNFAGGAPLRQAANVEAAAAKAAENPSAYLDLHYTGERQLDDDEIDANIKRWIKARRGANGGVGWSSKYLEVRELGSYGDHLLVEGRNAEAVNVARLAGLPAAMLDATAAGASLTYETTEGRNAQFIDYGLGLYLDPIASRLSLDDVVPRGQSTRWDTGELRTLTPSATGPATAD